MPYLVLGIALLAGLLLLARWLTRADPRVLAWVARVVGGVLLAAVGGYVLFSGRFQWLLYAAPFALPFFFHFRSQRLRARNARGPSPGQRSEVSTDWLRASLDHDTGEMTGTVTRGRFAGRALEDMTLEELLALLADCAGDADSVRVLEAYLDRVHGADWRDRGPAGAGGGGRRRGAGPEAAMTEEEACEVLGVGPDAGPDEIKAAHRRLMSRMHPDRGGSTYLSAKLNQAREVLLARRR